MAQPRPRIDFDTLLKDFPDLPWSIEIRYVAKDSEAADMLRIHFDGQADAVRWRPEYAGSLASVCESTIPQGELKRLLTLMRDSNFNDLPTESENVIAVAIRGEQIVSVRLGKTVVRKIDRGNLNNAGLRRIQENLTAILDSISSESGAQCKMESVPARP